MQVSDFEKALGCLLAVREERSNGVNGMLGVLFILRNRSLSDGQGFPRGWLANIEGHNQFSSMTVIGDSQTVYYPDPREPNFQRVLQLVDGVYDNSMADALTQGALYYADLGSKAYNHGGWFDRNIVGRPDVHPRVAQIGTTTYFK